MGKFIKKFDNGNSTPQEYHQKHAFSPSAKCDACGARPIVRAIVLVEVAEARKRGLIPSYSGIPEVEAHVAASMIDLKGPSGPVKYFRTSVAYSCAGCRRNMEKALAKAPSWTVVDIQNGPDPTNRVVFGSFGASV